jgi:hypothetical protein
MPVSLEELIVALADKLWKGARNSELEERVVERVAACLEQDRWALFVELDTSFEDIAAGGADRLERSRRPWRKASLRVSKVVVFQMITPSAKVGIAIELARCAGGEGFVSPRP